MLGSTTTHEHIVVRRLVLAVLLVPLVREVILDLLRHMVVLERPQPTEPRMFDLLRLGSVLATELFRNVIQILDGVGEVVVSAPAPLVSCGLVAASGLFVAAAALRLFGFPIVGWQRSIVFTDNAIHTFLPRDHIQALIYHSLRVLSNHKQTKY